MRIFRNQSGSTLVQILVAGSVVLGVGGYLLTNTQNQGKLQKFEQNRDEAYQQINQVSDFLTDYENCKATFNQTGALTGGLTTIRAKNNSVAYASGAQLKAGKILGFTVLGYSPSPGTRYREIELKIKFKFNETRVNDTGSFGALEKIYSVPVYMITEDSTVVTCMSNQSHSIQDAMRQSCTEFGGDFNETSGRCENLHGPNGVVLRFTRDNFCASGPTCPHPNRSMACSGVDVRGIARGNWVVGGFSASGSLECTCMPVTCPNPADYCLNKDLDTDWCYQECPRGTWDPQDWGPDPSTVCNGQPFSQTNTCGRTRPQTGTYDPGDYGPDPSDVCDGVAFTQTNSCGATISATGTKTCP